MDFQTYSKNVIVTESLQQYLESKLQHVEKLGVKTLSCRVDFSRDQHHHKGDIFRVEINVSVPGKLLRIVELHEDIRAAIDLATDKLLRQVRKFKSKKMDKERRPSRFPSNEVNE
ncbi:MAG: ribosome-associated translation inhibitor RaiA [Patescibacteria group bacterium]